MRSYLHKTPWWLRILYPGCLWRVPTDKQEIYLTFDDGPKPGITEFVLDQLKKYEQKATFFCVGSNVEKYPELASRIRSEGHAMGNHTHRHLNGWKTSHTVYLEDVSQCREVLKPYVSDKNKPLFRPPYGRFKRSQLRVLRKRYRIVMWDYLIGDFDLEIDPRVCLKNAISGITPGSIVVFHDSTKASACLKEVLPSYLKYLSSHGYKGLTLDS